MSRPTIGLLAVVSTGVYLALTIACEGGVGAILARPPVLAVLVVTAAASVVSVFSQGNVSKGLREDRANRWVLTVFGVLGVLGAVLPALSDRNGWGLIGGGDAVRWLGVGLYVVGIVVRIVPVFVLGKRFSGLVAIQPGHTLVTDGVYSRIRNPSYLGFIVLTLGWGLAFDAWIGVLLTVLTIPPLVARMDAEERMLRSEFGDAFEVWRARTWRLVPGIY